MSTPMGGGGERDEEFQKLVADVPDLHWQALLRHNRPLKPIIAAVEGYAVAGGTEILQGTDIRVAAEDAIFGVTEARRGLSRCYAGRVGTEILQGADIRRGGRDLGVTEARHGLGATSACAGCASERNSSPRLAQ